MNIKRVCAGFGNCTIWVILFMTPICLDASSTLVAPEKNLQAIFLYRFTGFITWPKDAFPSDESPFYICVLGEDTLGKALDLAIENQKSGNHPIVAKRFREFSKINSCHIVFVSESEKERLTEVFNFSKKYPLLTVSDIEDFVERGGMIKIINIDKKLRLTINPDTIEEVRLKADANLLRLSTIVRSR